MLGTTALVWPPLRPTISNNAQQVSNDAGICRRNVALVRPRLNILVLSQDWVGTEKGLLNARDVEGLFPDWKVCSAR